MRRFLYQLLVLTLTLAAFSGEHAFKAERLVYQTEQPGVFLEHTKSATSFRFGKQSRNYALSGNTLSPSLFERSLVYTAIVGQALREHLDFHASNQVLTITQLPKSHLATPGHPAGHPAHFSSQA